MKKLNHKLSRVNHSLQYPLLPSDRSNSQTARRLHSPTPKCLGHNHVVQVGLDDAERFVINAELLRHPIFIQLLNISAQEYGYNQRGILKIPVHVPVFKRVLESLYLGQEQYSCLDEVVQSAVPTC